MSSYNLYFAEHYPYPENGTKYYDPNSGWGRPDTVTTTREYNNFTVDFVHSKSDWVVSHKTYKQGSKSRFCSLFRIPEPISVLHPSLVKIDRWISNEKEGSNLTGVGQGSLGQCLVSKIIKENNTGKSHLTVLLHQGGEPCETLNERGYIEVLFTEEYKLEKSKRNRFIYNLNGDCIDSQSEIGGTSISTNERSDTPLSVLDIDQTKTEELKDFLCDWFITEYEFYENCFDELTPSELAKITDYIKVCNQVLEETKDKVCDKTNSTIRQSLNSNIKRLLTETIRWKT